MLLLLDLAALSFPYFGNNDFCGVGAYSNVEWSCKEKGCKGRRPVRPEEREHHAKLRSDLAERKAKAKAERRKKRKAEEMAQEEQGVHFEW